MTILQDKISDRTEWQVKPKVLVAGFGIAVLTVVIAICAVALSSGVDVTQVEQASNFP